MDVCFFCGVPADQVCPHCGLVAFCSAECFSFHRPKGRCFPFRVAFSPVKGMHLVAARNIKVNTIQTRVSTEIGVGRADGLCIGCYNLAASI